MVKLKGIFISARTSSTRLPNKALLDLCGKPTIQYLIDNLKNSVHADIIILCTSALPEDKILCEIAAASGIDFFQGSLEDKLHRWRGACEEFNVDFFVNVDGDDLFFDFGLADLVFQQRNEEKIDFIDGWGLYNDVYGISYEALLKVCNDKENNEIEYIRPYFLSNHSLATQQLKNVPNKYIKKYRMTLDYKEDLDFFKTVIEGVVDSGKPLAFENIISFLEHNPTTKDINFFLEEHWKKNQKKLYDIDHN